MSICTRVCECEQWGWEREGCAGAVGRLGSHTGCVCFYEPVSRQKGETEPGWRVWIALLPLAPKAPLVRRPPVDVNWLFLKPIEGEGREPGGSSGGIRGLPAHS